MNFSENEELCQDSDQQAGITCFFFLKNFVQKHMFSNEPLVFQLLRKCTSLTLKLCCLEISRVDALS